MPADSTLTLHGRLQAVHVTILAENLGFSMRDLCGHNYSTVVYPANFHCSILSVPFFPIFGSRGMLEEVVRNPLLATFMAAAAVSSSHGSATACTPLRFFNKQADAKGGVHSSDGGTWRPTQRGYKTQGREKHICRHFAMAQKAFECEGWCIADCLQPRVLCLCIPFRRFYSRRTNFVRFRTPVE